MGSTSPDAFLCRGSVLALYCGKLGQAFFRGFQLLRGHAEEAKCPLTTARSRSGTNGGSSPETCVTWQSNFQMCRQSGEPGHKNSLSACLSPRLPAGCGTGAASQGCRVSPRPAPHNSMGHRRPQVKIRMKATEAGWPQLCGRAPSRREGPGLATST